MKFRNPQNIIFGIRESETRSSTISKEIDLVIEGGRALTAYEIKWQNQRIKTPTQWLETYKTPVNLISRDQLLDILLEPTPSAE